MRHGGQTHRTHVLLLGAGFSRNWGGWLANEAMEYLLGCREVVDSTVLRRLLWKHQESGAGFEGALDELQTAAVRDPQGQARDRTALETALSHMFADMNRGFVERVDFNFSQQRARTVTTFLTRFDAIFSLNQDVLLERHYCNDNVMLSGQGWNGPSLPGLDRTRSAEPLDHHCWARSTWKPRPGGFALDPNYQPIFKLHGSSNWRSADGGAMLVIGGGKEGAISRHPILAWYAQQFEARILCGPVLGSWSSATGFATNTSTRFFGAPVEKGLRMFLIAPEGADLVFAQSPTRKRGQIIVTTPAEENLRESLIGASRRALSETFSDEGDVEFNKVMRFFDASHC